ncbi:MAG: GAF domain-containing protein [Alphaproteobacteria bacterium]|nr:GAF domain-containing protein [Alphaproteobacteria bacterium]
MARKGPARGKAGGAPPAAKGKRPRERLAHGKAGGSPPAAKAKRLSQRLTRGMADSRAELEAALAQKAALSEVLQAIAASRSDPQPVFKLIARRARELCNAQAVNVLEYDGSTLQLRATIGYEPRAAARYRRSFPRPLGRDTLAGRAIVASAVVQIADASNDSELFQAGRSSGARAAIAVPLLRDGRAIGCIFLSRFETRKFSASEIELVQTFADQAVIAIENARLFEEVQARNRDLTEALEQQTATAEVLSVIARSPTDLQPVLDVVAENAARLCNARDCVLVLVDGESMREVAHFGPIPGLEGDRHPVTRETVMGRSIVDGKSVHIHDLSTSQDFPRGRDLALRLGHRSIVSAPLMRNGKAFGALVVRRTEVRPFAEQQIALLETFADQAVIAIENTRLFEEVQARNRDLQEALESQTATSDVLKLISRSTFDLQKVLDTLLESAARLTSADIGTIRRRQGDSYEVAATFGFSPEARARIEAYSPLPDRSSIFGQAVQENHTVHIPDILADPDYARPDVQRITTFRAALGVLLRREGNVIGVLVLQRLTPGPFTARQIELVETFADQAVIAIENARLFEEVQARNRDLTEALEQQTATADILGVIASSPTDLKPVLDVVVTNAARLCTAFDCALVVAEGDTLRELAHFGPIPFLGDQRFVLTRASVMGRAVLDGEVVHVRDLAEAAEFPEGSALARQHGNRTTLAAPLLREGKPFGALVVRRKEVRPFSDKQIALLQTFADQAVIAIENTRLFTELREALDQQTATSEVLQVINSSPSELGPVFEAMLEKAMRLCGAMIGELRTYDGHDFQQVAARGMPQAYVEYYRNRSITYGPGTGPARIAAGEPVVHIPDLVDTDAYRRRDPDRVALVELGGAAASLLVPLAKDERVMGYIMLVRQKAGAFSDKQIALLQTFADQAVIAIENARLFEEVQARTRDVTEALEYQTATSEVLSVISRSPTDVQPVLDALVESAARLCEADFAVIRRREGDVYPVAASVGLSPQQHEQFIRYDTTPDRGTIFGRAIVEQRAIHIPDVLADPEFGRPEVQQVATVRAGIGVPLIREGVVIGVISVMRRQPQSFSQRQIDLVATFADQAVIAIENARLFNETKEALERQTATAEVLQVISRSTFDLQPVFDTLVENAVRLCGAQTGMIFLRDGAIMRLAAAHGASDRFVDYVREHNVALDHQSITGRAAVEARTIHVLDVTKDPEYGYRGQPLENYRSVVGVPLLRDGQAVGVFTLWRHQVEAFTSRQLSLVETFVDQAVIAIENARLFEEVQARTQELVESLHQQTATGEVLKAISRSAFDVGPVFEAVLENAVKLCEAERAFLFRFDGKLLRAASSYNASPALRAWIDQNPIAPGRQSISARAALERRTVHVADVQADRDYAYALKDVDPIRTILAVPMLKGDELVGTITLYKLYGNPFTSKQIELVETFAAQAVIAIENVRLFNETREALERQTAMGEILRIISTSPADLQPVLDAIAANAARLCETDEAVIWQRYGDELRPGAAWGGGVDPLGRLTLSRRSIAGRAIYDRAPVHVVDLAAVFASEFPDSHRLMDSGYRSVLAVPLLSKGDAIGAIIVRRAEVRPYTEAQIGLLGAFADQAVIAIENTRLFGELEARTRELSDSLETQTATSYVLDVISRSPAQLQPVFDAIAQSAVRLFKAQICNVLRFDGELLFLVASDGLSAEAKELARRHFPSPPGKTSAASRCILSGAPAEIPDIGADPDYRPADVAEVDHYRSVVAVPMLKDGRPVGVIAVGRAPAGRMDERQIALLKTFADQAVIAVENARLFDEVRARTEDLTESLRQQTATADVLKVISRSTFDLQTVLRTLLETAVRLCEADQGTITRQRDGKFYRAEAYGHPPEFLAAVKDLPVEPERGSVTGRALLEGHTVHVPDIAADPEFTFAEARALGGFRTALGVPMMKEGVPIGGLAITRRVPRPFTPKQIELVSTFADQAAIAIENVRLFESVESRTRELARSIEELRAAQDRLVQTEKLASLGQLTAGIAHEIKNPLNFVNNFAAVSVELIDELSELVQRPSLSDEQRAEIGELATMVRDNLAKVVHHGKRADSIVKNMLLHSREGSGEHRLIDINGVVEESLNLAYHGARAERRDFNITMERSLDPAAGQVDLFPQEITRVLLNLISNGFYAAMKRRAQGGDPAYEPKLLAATRSLGDSVEIRIRDNGTGIPPEVREKIFNPFFTTKPPGEGTGLGLSLSHDIVVKQHAGSIAVESEPGQYTEFRIVLPRGAATVAQSGARV